MALTEVDRLIRVPRVEAGDKSYYEPRHHDLKDSRWKKWLRRAKEVGGTGVPGLRAATAPALEVLADHWMSIAAAGCADWAAFLWNEKSGLITAAVLLILLELKVSE